jgi:hypothetical protein
MKILGLAGSLRRASYNRALLQAALELAPSGWETETFDSLGTLPFYDGGPAAGDRRGGRTTHHHTRIQRRHERRPEERAGLGVARSHPAPGRQAGRGTGHLPWRERGQGRH